MIMIEISFRRRTGGDAVGCDQQYLTISLSSVKARLARNRGMISLLNVTTICCQGNILVRVAALAVLMAADRTPVFW
jgi:hypothetical protein